MKVLVLVLFVVVVVLSVMTRTATGELPPPEASYNILMLLPVSSKSHRNVFVPVAEALAERGHKITILSNQPKKLKYSNIHEFSHGITKYNENNNNLFDYRKDPTGGLSFFKEVLPAFAREIYAVPKVMELYERRKEFDVIIIDHLFNEMMYPFLHEMPFMTIATGGMDPRQSAVLGNVLNPSFALNLLSTYPTPMSAWQRFVNTVAHIGLAVYWRHWTIVPNVQKEITAQFPDLPPLLEIERNQSVALLNSHFSITQNVPLLPSQVEIGAMHCRPARPLPQELESWINGAGPEGVIYFSLGSVARSSTMPVQYRDALVDAFRRLPHRVIWKYEEELEGLPENVIRREWLPQQDILGHEKVKVFISHAGLLSMQESIYHATPLLALPIFADQPKNAAFAVHSGIAETLVWEELTVEAIVDALTKLTSNPKYKENILGMSRRLRDQLTTPKERAVFWTEYVIRHQGAPQLRSPAAQLSWVEFLMLDVLFVLHVALFVSVYILRRLVRAIKAKIFGTSGRKKKTK